MKFKLVEKLNIIDYSRKLTEALDTSMLSDEDFEVIESSDKEEIYKVVLKILNDPNNIKYEKYSDSLQHSILKYKSFDPKSNPFVAMIDAADSGGDILDLSDSEMYDVIDIIENEKLPTAFIINNFSRNGIAELLKKDPKWVIRIFKILSDKNHGYMDGKNKVTIKNFLKNANEFETLEEMKKLADKFSKEDREDLISVKDWFKEVAQLDKDADIYKNLLTAIENSNLEADKKSNLNIFIKNLFSNDPEWKRIRSYVLNYTEINQYTKPQDIEQVLSSMYNYYSERYDSDFSVDISLKNYLENTLKIQDLAEQLQKIKELIINDSSISEKDKQNIDIIIKKLGKKENSKLLKTLLAINIPDESKAATYINKEIQKLVESDYLETTIEDALLAIGVQPEEGLRQLHDQVRDNPEYANLLNSLWQNTQMRRVILSKPINKIGKDFSWKESVIDFLENVIDRGQNLSLGKLLIDIGKIQPSEQIDQIIDWVKRENDLSTSSLNSVNYKLHQLLDKQQNATFKKLMQLQILDPENITKDIIQFINDNLANFGRTTIADALRYEGYNTPELEGQRFLQSNAFKKQLGERSKFLDKFDTIWKDPQEKAALLNASIEFKNGKFNWLQALNTFMNSHEI